MWDQITPHSHHEAEIEPAVEAEIEALCLALTRAQIKAPYARTCEQERCYEAFCAILERLHEARHPGYERAVSWIDQACAGIKDSLRRAPRAWLRRLARGEPVSALRVSRHLAWCGEPLEREQLARWCKAPELEAITILRLDEAELSCWAAELLAGLPALGALRELYLGYNDLGDEALAGLFERGRFDALEVLSVAGNQLGDRACVRLTDNATLRRLKALCLNQNRIGDRGVRALALWRAAASLERLHLYGNVAITDEGAEALERRLELGFSNLYELDLYDCAVSAKRCQRLQRATPALSSSSLSQRASTGLWTAH